MTTKTLKKFVGTYAVDVPSYVDFIVEATSKGAATKIMREALKAGKFDLVECEAEWNSARRRRVFLLGEADALSTETTLDELVARTEPEPRALVEILPPKKAAI